MIRTRRLGNQSLARRRPGGGASGSFVCVRPPRAVQGHENQTAEIDGRPAAERSEFGNGGSLFGEAHEGIVDELNRELVA